MLFNLINKIVSFNNYLLNNGEEEKATKEQER